MRSILKNKKGQIIDNPIIAVFVLIFILLLLSPIMLKIFLSVHTNIGNSLGNVTGGGEIAKANFQKVTGTLITFWDKVILFAFILAVIILFVSAFLIDAHPFFVFLYIIINFLLIIFIPDMKTALDNIYDSPTFTTEIIYLTFVDALRTYLVPIIIGLMVITGIIIYGKLAFTSRSNNRR